MELEELIKKYDILNKAFNKMRRRMNLLEDRLEKVDGVKTLRPDIKESNG